MPGALYGFAEGTNDAMQQMLEQRILQERMALQQRQQAAEEAWRASQLGEQQASRGDAMTRHTQTLGEDRRQFDAGEPSRVAGVRLSGVQADKGTYDLDRAKTDDVASDTALDELATDPKTAGLARFKRAGVTMPGIDPSDPTGEVDQARALGRITASGDQNVRSAAAGRAARTVTIKTVDENGQPVTKIIPLDDATGQEYGAQPTAEMRNRGGAGKRAGKVVDRLESLSKRINVNKGLTATAAGAAQRAAAKVNYNNDVAEYERYLAANAPLIARAFGHTGVLTQMDVDSVVRGAPSPGDNDELASRLIAGMRQTMADMSDVGTGDTTPAGASSPAPVRRYNPATGKLEP